MGCVQGNLCGLLGAALVPAYRNPDARSRHGQSLSRPIGRCTRGRRDLDALGYRIARTALERSAGPAREGRSARGLACGRSATIQKGGRRMEPGNVEHAGGLDNGAHQGKRRKKKRAERPDALLRYLIEHEEFDAALLFTKGMYILYRRAGRELIPKGLSPATLRAAFVGESVDSGWLSPDVKRCGSGPTGPLAVKFIPPGKHTLRLSTGEPSKPLVVSVALPGLVFRGVNAVSGGRQATC